MSDRITRRRLLATTAATGAGVLAGGVFPGFAQETKEADLPVGASGKLTVIHRTEYFEQAQTLFRETVPDFRRREQRRARHLDDQPGVVRRLPGQDDGGREGRQSARLRLHQQRLDPADAPARPGRGRDRRGRRGRQQVRRHHAGHQRREDRPVRRQVEGRFRSSAARTGYFIRGDKLKEKGIDPATPQDLRRAPRGGARHLRSGQRVLGLGPHAQPVRRRLRLPDPR